jgi:hypothetical protein
MSMICKNRTLTADEARRIGCDENYLFSLTAPAHAQARWRDGGERRRHPILCANASIHGPGQRRTSMPFDEEDTTWRDDFFDAFDRVKQLFADAARRGHSVLVWLT